MAEEFGQNAQAGDRFDNLVDPPQPAGAPAAEPSPVAAAPAAVPEVAAAPAAPVAEIAPATPAAPVVDPQKAYTDQLRQQNLQLTQTMQELATAQRAMLDKQLKETQPELTPAQRQEKIAKAFEGLNADPEAYIDGLIQSRLQAKEKELEARYAPRDPDQEAQRAIDKGLNSLWKNPQGVEVRPELAKTEFRTLMVSAPVAQAVYQKLYAGQDPAKVAQDPQFLVELYHEARSRATAAFAPTQQQAQTDAAAQTAVAAAHAATPGGKAPTGPAPAADPDQAFIAEMRAAGKSPTDTLLEILGQRK